MNNNPFSLENKTILVTGASSGIGKEIAVQVSNMGGSVILNGRNTERLKVVAHQISNDSTQIIQGDLTDPSTIAKIIESTPQIDGVVHAAGIMKLVPFKFINANDLKEMMNINFTSPTLLSLELIKNKKLKNSSSIVYITSINGSVVGSRANSMYAASKGALTGMIKAMALDLAKTKIRVNEIAPGMIETEGTMEIESIVSEVAINEDKMKYPLGCYGKPDDVAFACVYLLSNASKWVTGSKLVVDGGFTIS
jgi:NAD(P)-dependent dehydrogenase (short-subunit alcohol dehydrogenase family)